MLNALDPISVLTETSPPDVTQLTTKSLTGTGVFDVLMKTVKLHLIEEYDNDRITGAQYSDVYIGALGAVLQQSVAFLLNHQNEKRVIAEIALTRQKTVTELANTGDTIPVGLGFNTNPVIEGLIKSKLDLDALEADLVAAKIDTDKANKALVGQKIITELAQTDIGLTQARLAGYGFNDADIVSGVMEQVTSKAKAEVDLTEQKVVTELAQTSKVKPSTLGLDPATTISGLAKSQTDLTESQKAKADAEKIFLNQKTITELAQTSDSVPLTTGALNTASTVSGSIEKQKDLYSAQIAGFKRDAEQKLLKIITSTWSTAASVSGVAATTVTNKLDDDSLGTIMGMARKGIGLDLP